MAGEQITTKAAALEAAQHEYANLMQLIDGLTGAQMIAPATSSGASIKYLLEMLTLRLEILIDLVEHDGKLSSPVEIDEYDTDYGYRAYYSPTLAQALLGFEQAHNSVREMFEQLPEEALTDPNHYPWRNGEPLLKKLVDETSSHYREDMGYIRAYIYRVKGKLGELTWTRR